MSSSPDIDTTPDTGLTSQEALALLERFGPNRLPAPPRRRLSSRVLEQVRDPMILLLLAAAVLTAVLHDLSNTVIIAVVVLFNTSVGVGQQLRAERAMTALQAMTAPTTRVVRDGAVVELPSDDVVPGDLVKLAAGDVVPADGLILAAATFQANQALMTGESLPVDLDVGDQVIGGTSITRGRATVSISRTGADSGIGSIAKLLGRASPRPTPLQRRLTQLSRWLVVVISALTLIVVVNGLIQGRPVGQMALVGLSLAVAAVPESLPAVVTIALAMGAHRMAKRKAVVRTLPAVETLGSVTVVATDKTGTITEGTMLVQHVWTPGATYSVSGSGYAPTGSLTADQPVGDADADLARLLRDVALCNDATLSLAGDTWKVLGDPLEGALLTLSAKGGHDVDVIRVKWARIAEEPFDQRSMRMTTHHLGPDGQTLTVCKGAPEAVFGLVGADAGTQTAEDAATALAAQGYRVLAVADGPHADALELVGLVGVGDPPRGHARQVVSDLRRAGIRVVLVTGDHPSTAASIAHSVGIDEHDVISRVRPEEKVSVVEGMLGDGGVVAMIGDGVNDAPALRRADIGVAQGSGGSEVAKQASDLVLMDDDLSTVVAAVEEGRRIFANIRAFLIYALAGGLSEVGVMLFGPAIGLTLPLLPGQILWINLLTHGITGVAFGNEPADSAEMAQPPRPPADAILNVRACVLLGVAAVTMTAMALMVGAMTDGSDAERRTAIFLVLGFAQLGVALALRSGGNRRAVRTRGLEAAVLMAAALQLIAVFAPWLQELLGTVAPSGSALIVLGLVSLVPALTLRVVMFGLGRSRRAVASS